MSDKTETSKIFTLYIFKKYVYKVSSFLCGHAFL